MISAEILPMRDNVIVITIDKLPNKQDTLVNVFRVLAEEKVNVDMISSVAECSHDMGVSFSAVHADMQRLLEALKKVRMIYPCVVTNMCCGNTKIVLCGDMKNEAGVAARVFSCLAENEIEIRLLTTSENEISLAVSEGSADAAHEALEKEFKIKTV